jgi:hypothetical protein
MLCNATGLVSLDSAVVVIDRMTIAQACTAER